LKFEPCKEIFWNKSISLKKSLFVWIFLKNRLPTQSPVSLSQLVEQYIIYAGDWSLNPDYLTYPL
jgi:hypothetical protein